MVILTVWLKNQHFLNEFQWSHCFYPAMCTTKKNSAAIRRSASAIAYLVVLWCEDQKADISVSEQEWILQSLD